MSVSEITIGRRKIGENHPVYIVAELSGNHLHKIENAIRLIEEAHKAGADAVKLQTYTADTITIKSDRPEFRIASGTAWDGRTFHDLYREAFTPWEWQPELFRRATELGMDCFTSVFDDTAADFALSMGVPAFKIASFEITDLPLIEHVASFRKPVIISTGIATLDEITEAVETCRQAGNEQIALLKCTSSYPAPVEHMNLRTIPDMIERFRTVVGLSDHSLSGAVPAAAVALGARIIEKHLTLSRSMGGPDATFSLEPHEFAELVRTVRDVEKALGRVSYEPDDKTIASRIFSRSLFVVENMRKGEKFSRKNVRSIRPHHGLPPKYLNRILGCTASRDIEAGTPLSWELVSEGRERCAE